MNHSALVVTSEHTPVCSALNVKHHIIEQFSIVCTAVYLIQIIHASHINLGFTVHVRLIAGTYHLIRL